MIQNINLGNPVHQHILLKLTLIHYASGDCKDVYEDEEMRLLIQQEFGPSTDDEIAEFLGRDDVHGYYSHWDKLRVTNDWLPEPIFTTLPTGDFINSQERVMFKKDGQDYIIYGPEQVGDPDNLWAVFRALPEDECGSDDGPDYEFATYKELQEWANEDSLPEQEICM